MKYPIKTLGSQSSFTSTNYASFFTGIRRLIFLSFHSAEASSPERNFRFISGCDLIPPSEDSYDYDPDICVHRLHTILANESMKELIIVSEENAKRIQIRNIKVSLLQQSTKRT